MSVNEFRPTQLRDLYDALSALKQSEQTALALAHAADATMLNRRLAADVRTVARYPTIANAGLVGKQRKAFPVPFEVTKLSSTIEFASAICDGVHEVTGRPDLRFEYVEREVVPLNGSSLARRSMDLLLRSVDGTPILAELKRGPDNLPYYALVQLLVHAVESSSPVLRQRFVDHGFSTSEVRRPVDLALFAYGDPHVTYHDASLSATKTIAEALLASPELPLAQFVRRIAYLHAEVSDRSLVFRPVFVVDAPDSAGSERPG